MENVSIGIIDYIGVVGDGVGILLSIKIIDTIYEIIYWFNYKGNIKIVPANELLILLNIDSIYDYPDLEGLIDKIEEVIPDKISILKEFKILV